MPPIGVGHLVGGKYELARLLGRGSMGEVWVAHHRTLGEDVALKLLAAASPTVEVEGPFAAAARFRFEAQLAARLSRKTRHIVRVTDHGEEGDGLAYLVMELLEGKTLERTLLFGALPPAEVSRLVMQTARALEHAHAEGVVHRDLKPGNVFLARDEEGGLLAKLLDFGIARTMRTQRILAPFTTGEGLVFGTPGYMSPEQACGTRVDAQADLWALATVAYEALTGELPFPGLSTEELLQNLHAGRRVPVHERDPTLPRALAAFFDTAFAPRIGRRFASASQLALEFERAVRARDNAQAGTWPMTMQADRQECTLPMAGNVPRVREMAAPRGRSARMLAAAWVGAGAALFGAVLASQAGRTLVHTSGPPAPSASTLDNSVAAGLEPEQPRLTEPAPPPPEPSVSEAAPAHGRPPLESRPLHPPKSDPSHASNAPSASASTPRPQAAAPPPATPVTPQPAESVSGARPDRASPGVPVDKSAIL